MKILLLITILLSFLHAELTIEEKTQLYTSMITTKKENFLFSLIKHIDKEYNSIKELGEGGNAKFEKVNSLAKKDRFDYTNAIKKMCQGIFTVDGINCPRQIFVMAILQDDKCKTVATSTAKKTTNNGMLDLEGLMIGTRALMFENADPYYNKDECYVFSGTLSQRLDEDTALFTGDTDTFLLDLPKDRYSEGNKYIGVIKGSGKYKYTTILGSSKTVPKGKVMSIQKQ